MEQEQPRRKRNNKDRPLTPRQRAIMECIIHSVESRGFPPAVREICEAVGLSSGSTVHAHLNTLEERGYIRRDPAKPRAILILRGIDGEEYTYVREEQEEAEQLEEMLNLPVVGNVAAGEPIFADENIEDIGPALCARMALSCCAFEATAWLMLAFLTMIILLLNRSKWQKMVRLSWR